MPTEKSNSELVCAFNFFWYFFQLVHVPLQALHQSERFWDLIEVRMGQALTQLSTYMSPDKLSIQEFSLWADSPDDESSRQFGYDLPSATQSLRIFGSINQTHPNQIGKPPIAHHCRRISATFEFSGCQD